MWCCSLPLPRPRHKGASDIEDQKHMPANNRKAKTQSEGPAAPSSASAERARLEGVAARRHARRARAYIALVMVALAATLGAATYAWFTSNMKVNTNSVSVHSDTSKLVLELGDAGRGSWSQQGDASLASTANGAVTLYPVSTFDLNGFAACAQNNSAGDATVFEQAKDNGSAFYHGWIDLRPTITGTGANKVKGKVNLYLAESLVPQGADAELLRAARVGIKISSGSQVLATNIFELDSSDGGHRGEHPMTVPAGLAGYTEGMLLGWQNGQLACGANVTQDPATFTLDTSETAERPQNSLATLALGQTYRLDIYYYIEGTDPDSADYLHQDPGTLHLALFATLDGE